MDGKNAEGGFSFREAAARVEPGDGPKLHEIDAATGDLVVSNRLVSAQLSPRDRLTPPCIQLVEAIVELYAARTGAERAVVDRELNVLYQAASTYCEDTLEPIAFTIRPRPPPSRCRSPFPNSRPLPAPVPAWSGEQSCPAVPGRCSRGRPLAA